ncbi:hypothetical protein V1506DRAFT_549599 [Lipomyces tetrasporus]
MAAYGPASIRKTVSPNAPVQSPATRFHYGTVPKDYTSALHSPQFDLEQLLLQLFIDLHTSNPDHEIFGKPAQGLVRLPLYSARIGEPSWAKTCGSFAVRVIDEMKSDFQLEGRWMSRTRYIQITRTSKGNQVMYRQVSILRLLAFLAEPTPLHWTYLSGSSQIGIQQPSSDTVDRQLIVYIDA